MTFLLFITKKLNVFLYLLFAEKCKFRFQKKNREISHKKMKSRKNSSYGGAYYKNISVKIIHWQYAFNRLIFFKKSKD